MATPVTGRRWPRDHSRDLSEASGRLDEGMDRIAGGRVDGRDAHLVTGVLQDFRCGVGVLFTQVG